MRQQAHVLSPRGPTIPSTHLTFSSAEAHRTWLEGQSALPRGFRVGRTRFDFMPAEVARPAKMNLTLVVLDEPTPAFAAVFTKNAFPGAPVLVGRERLESPTLGALIINNKVSNVCAPGGREASERVCAAVAAGLGLTASQVLPCSTGVIGWRLPVDAMEQAVPAAVASLAGGSVLPAAEGIMTTDLYPKVRRAQVGEGGIVGIAKGAGMIEPNLATMLVFLLTDLDVPRDTLRACLRSVASRTFGCISVDSDTSTSDTVALVSSRQVPCPDLARFEAALEQVCADLAEDIVRNGEGVHHVMRVRVRGALDERVARGVGKSVVNSPLFQCAVNGNDPNVGRLVAAIGKYVGEHHPGMDLSRCTLRMGGRVLLEHGTFRLDHEAEAALVAHMKGAELYASVPPPDGLTFRPPVAFPPHERAVEIDVDLGSGPAECLVLGADRSHEYISENADYRS
ncbi:bifunctional ornithine acetyltransferase/N-acetylglutamate synthase [Melittangium boletus]|uniref:Arginine biosynthesis bifunctional protein ArgJ n=1 Tax=Melittangium boletus DSM 14713 TaxID=1294270 RepID=A0A250IIC9_9BACT|nr:bifunctional ornithine acetyltransferase/N-acetylglutamate synthase [Melittangium boletus]ATB31579.1 arginine biosynthesis protein ArgJ [Melittangium boletus DSM 14713]